MVGGMVCRKDNETWSGLAVLVHREVLDINDASPAGFGGGLELVTG